MKLYVLNTFHDFMWSFWIWVGFIKSVGDLAQQKKNQKCGKILKQKTLNLAFTAFCSYKCWSWQQNTLGLVGLAQGGVQWHTTDIQG